MAKKQLTGASAFGGGLDWQVVPDDRDVARRVLLFLEDRRVLTQDPSREDYEGCRKGAQKIRNYVDVELGNTQEGGPLEHCLRRMRTASAAFITAAGQKSVDFKDDHSYFVSTLEAYRDTLATQIAQVSYEHKLQVPHDLQPLLHRLDLSAYTP